MVMVRVCTLFIGVFVCWAVGRPSACAVSRPAVAPVRRAELRRLLKGTDPSRSRPGTPALRRHHNGPPRLTSRPEQHPQPPPRTTPMPCRETAPTRGDRGRSTGAAPVKDCSEGDRGRRRRGTPTQPPQGTTDQGRHPLTDPLWLRPPRGAVPRCHCVYSPARLTEADNGYLRPHGPTCRQGGLHFHRGPTRHTSDPTAPRVKKSPDSAFLITGGRGGVQR